MRVAFFEDDAAEELHPLTLTRPIFELLCGQYSTRERAIRHLPVQEWGAFLRESLTETYREAHPDAAVNDWEWLKRDETLLINGRWLADVNSLQQLDPSAVGFVGGTLVYLTISASEAEELSRENWTEQLQAISKARRPVEAGGVLPRYPWDLVEHNSQLLQSDFNALGRRNSVQDFGPQVEVVGDRSQVHVSTGVDVEPFVVLDTRGGPISIDAGAVIQAFTRLEGPCHIGHNSRLFRANIRGGTTIGPTCRVGGEIETSIFHGYANKYHDGFIGHSYICPWVNLGAETTNSDLKNDYSQVRIPLSGEMLDSGLAKVGAFIGDHVKTGLGSLFNTGSSIGVMSMVLPSGELLPKYIPSFSSFRRNQLVPTIDLENGLEAARIAMHRRNCELTDAQERLLRFLFAELRAGRELAATHFRQRRDGIDTNRQLRAA